MSTCIAILHALIKPINGIYIYVCDSSGVSGSTDRRQQHYLVYQRLLWERPAPWLIWKLDAPVSHCNESVSAERGGVQMTSSRSFRNCLLILQWYRASRIGPGGAFSTDTTTVLRSRDCSSSQSPLSLEKKKMRVDNNKWTCSCSFWYYTTPKRVYAGVGSHKSSMRPP